MSEKVISEIRFVETDDDISVTQIPAPDLCLPLILSPWFATGQTGGTIPAGQSTAVNLSINTAHFTSPSISEKLCIINSTPGRENGKLTFKSAFPVELYLPSIRR